MSIADCYRAYAEAFEESLADDDWSRLEQYFTDDAVYRPDGTPASDVTGRDAVLARLKGGVDQFDRRMDSREISFTTDVDGDRSRLLATRIPAGGGRLVVVGTGTDVSDAAVHRAELALLVGGPPAVLLAGVAAWLLAGAVLRPVERMRRQATEISDRDLERRLAVPATRDEIAALAATMNALLARLQEALQRERGFVADAPALAMDRWTRSMQISRCGSTLPGYDGSGTLITNVTAFRSQRDNDRPSRFR